MRQYVVIFEQTENNWAAYAPDVPGCASTGKSREEAEQNFREALEFHFDGLRRAGMPIPEPAVQAGEVTIAA